MTEQQAQNKIKEAGGSWETFSGWICGQTCGLNEDGTLDIYDCDVDRFIRYKCDPKNEQLNDFD